MNKIRIIALSTFSFVLISLLNSCNKDKNENGSATLNVRLTDAPAVYDEVNIDIQEVKIKFSDDPNESGWQTLITTPGIYNLLDYQNGVDTLLATGVFPVQVLKQIRFILGPNNTITVAGVVYPLTIPSGAESGLKINLNRSLNATLNNVVIDFDAALSIHQEGTGDYKLRPVLQVR